MSQEANELRNMQLGNDGTRQGDWLTRETVKRMHQQDRVAVVLHFYDEYHDLQQAIKDAALVYDSLSSTGFVVE